MYEFIQLYILQALAEGGQWWRQSLRLIKNGSVAKNTLSGKNPALSILTNSTLCEFCKKVNQEQYLKTDAISCV
jgi:hypothetical protein